VTTGAAPDCLLVTYELASDSAAEAAAAARAIAYEQTVEVPEDVVPPDLAPSVIGRVERMTRIGKRRWRAELCYPEGVVGTSVPQLLNVLFGNISLKPRVRVVDLQWPAGLAAALAGPRFGIAAVRGLLPQAEGRALLCTALKPIGLTARELAAHARRFARGGVDLIKDDHGLADQATAPLAERVGRIQQAVSAAARETGRESLYLPHLTGPLEELPARLELLRREGVRGALVSPFLLGLDSLRWLASASGLVLLTHPTWSGTLFARGHGIAPEVVYGDLLRRLGADAVTHVNAGGRFPVSVATCEAIHARLRRPLPEVRPALPVVGGGVRVDTLPTWAARYGVDTVFLVGGSLYQQPDVESAARALVAALGAAGRSAAGEAGDEPALDPPEPA
jgi:ribulose-bisphosphate carboxylase large chain